MTNSSRTGDAPSQSLSAPVRWMALVVVVGGFMTILDTTIVNVALVAIEKSYGTTLADIQWIVTGYLLAVGATLPIAGWATRRFGARRIFLLSLVLFTVGSALSGIATSLPELIWFRVLQGIGGALILPVGQAALTRAGGVRNVARLTALIGGPMLLAPVLGPTIGGVLVDGPGWRWIFFVNIPVGLAALAIGWRYFLTEDFGRERAGRLDWLGLILLSAGLSGVMYGVSEVGVRNEVGNPHVLIPFAVGLALIGAFIAYARNRAGAILDIALYKDRAYSLASILMLTGGAVLFGSQVIMPLFFQQLRGESALQAGLLLIPQGIGVVIGTSLSGWLAMRIGGGISALIGAALVIVSTVPFVLADAATPYAFLVPALLVRGLGLGLSLLPAMTAAVVALRPDQIDDATPQLNALQRVGGSAGAAVLTVVLSRHIAGAQPLTLDAAASAFSATWVWALLITVVGVIPALWLARVERVGKRQAPLISSADALG